MIYRVLGEAAMLVHFAFLLYVVFGGFLTWKWPRMVLVHVPIALYGLAIAIVGWTCPLTYVENWGREQAGQSGMEGTGFIEHYLAGIIYPEGHLRTLQAVAGVVVLLSYLGAAVVWRRSARRRRDHGTGAADPMTATGQSRT
ncbi:DUF2784 domain-containing protein [Lipingzhangella sp. LS1_29]|uniref:DUF2784 domain-containing protein n=1 Tax=Lipingzhangella rawalii TaxID=2055835 RepID=A0ABU2H204_9ACTN|nr:DUF2784 domain-containing protein [Lipingzhangella rawalii]MDS1269338.1 DUF2784 domain-containing protein [Lipingzhangella rawalii]